MEAYDHLSDSLTRKTFARVIVHDPTDVYAAATSMTSVEPRFIEKLRLHVESLLGSSDRVGLIREGVRDIQTIFDAALEDCPEMSRQDALEVVRDPTTILAVAELALRESSRLECYALQPDRSRYFYIEPTRKQLLLGSKLPNHELSQSGCPYAGKGTETADAIRIDPLFKRFVPWAGTIAILHYFDNVGTPRYQLPTRLFHTAPA